MIVGLRAVGKCEVEILGVLAKLKGKGNKLKWKLNYEVCDRCTSGREKKRYAPTYSGPNFV
jgi:hypothetical protein